MLLSILAKALDRHLTPPIPIHKFMRPDKLDKPQTLQRKRHPNSLQQHFKNLVVPTEEQSTNSLGISSGYLQTFHVTYF